MPKAKSFFSENQLSNISNAISEAEKYTTGEIRVHLNNQCKEAVLTEAWNRFAKLEMHKTDRRNGILIFISIEDRKMAIVADEGINQKQEQGAWQKMLDQLLLDFSSNNAEAGLIKCIKNMGKELQSFFPKEKDSNNPNELTNEVSIE